MSELTTIADIVKSPDAIKTIMAILGYNFLNPITAETGKGLGKIIQKNLEHTCEVIIRKRKDTDLKTNLRTAMEGFRSAAFADSKIAAEYFGGILASSGASEDDSLISYLSLIRDLSSKQLHLHYIIYRRLHDLILNNPKLHEKNLGLQNDTSSLSVFFSSTELNDINVFPSEDLSILYNSGLINSYEYKHEATEDNLAFSFTQATPSILGFQVYAVVHNEYQQWRNLRQLDLESFPNILLPEIYFENKQEFISSLQYKTP